jgi:hypothetical protein
VLAPYKNRDALEVARDLDRKVEDPLRQAAARASAKEHSWPGVTRINKTPERVSSQPRFHQHAAEIQAYGAVNHLQPLDLEQPVRLEMTAQLNSSTDTMTLRDFVQRSRTGRSRDRRSTNCTCSSISTSTSKVELVDSIAERI